MELSLSPGIPGHLQVRAPVLVCNLFSLIGLLVTCDQLPSSTEERLPEFSTSLDEPLALHEVGSPSSGYRDHMFGSVKQIWSHQGGTGSGWSGILSPVSSQGLSPMSSSDLWLFPGSSGDNAKQQMGQSRCEVSASLAVNHCACP